MVNGGRRTAGGAEARCARASSLATASPCARSLARALLATFVAVALSGCGNIEPWVKPYERQNLADPIMSFDLNPVSSAYIDHVYEAREGARGALGGSGGGCGCN
jgi:hypothetical protein